MDEETEIIFRGHLDECLRHMAERYKRQIRKGSPIADKAKRPIAEFCGVTTQTVQGWFFDGSQMPIGETWIKLICYLDLLGYKVIEFERMKTALHNFMLLIGFGILSLQQAAESLSYTKAHALSQAFHDKSGVSKEKELKMWELWKTNKDQLSQKMKETKQNYALLFSLTDAESLKAEVIVDPQIGEASNQMAIINIMNGLLILIDNESIDELVKIFDSISAKNLDRLLAKLNLLNQKLTENQRGGG